MTKMPAKDSIGTLSLDISSSKKSFCKKSNAGVDHMQRALNKDELIMRKCLEKIDPFNINIKLTLLL